MISIFKPSLPKFSNVYPLLEACEQRCIYSNNGPLMQEFEAQFAKYFGLNSSQVCMIANGTLALFTGLKALDLPDNAVCLMPAWTFTATPAAAQMANLKIIFCDVDKESMMLTPDIALNAISEFNAPIDVVIPVSAFGAPLNSAAWDEFTEKTGIPVLIDGAASFDKATVTQTPTMLSLHATKIFGIGEGGTLLSKNEDFIQKARQYANFGFKPGQRVSEVSGTNARLNEIMAAIGLIALEQWPITRSHYQRLWELYKPFFTNHHYFKIQPGFGDHWLSTNFNLILPQNRRNQLAAHLKEHDIESRSWWHNGCHQLPAYQNTYCLDLTNTQELIDRILALPFHLYLEPTQVEQICNILDKFESNHYILKDVKRSYSSYRQLYRKRRQSKIIRRYPKDHKLASNRF